MAKRHKLCDPADSYNALNESPRSPKWSEPDSPEAESDDSFEFPDAVLVNQAARQPYSRCEDEEILSYVLKGNGKNIHRASSISLWKSLEKAKKTKPSRTYQSLKSRFLRNIKPLLLQSYSHLLNEVMLEELWKKFPELRDEIKNKRKTDRLQRTAQDTDKIASGSYKDDTKSRYEMTSPPSTSSKETGMSLEHQQLKNGKNQDALDQPDNDNMDSNSSDLQIETKTKKQVRSPIIKLHRIDSPTRSMREPGEVSFLTVSPVVRQDNKSERDKTPRSDKRTNSDTDDELQRSHRAKKDVLNFKSSACKENEKENNPSINKHLVEDDRNKCSKTMNELTLFRAREREKENVSHEKKGQRRYEALDVNTEKETADSVQVVFESEPECNSSEIVISSDTETPDFLNVPFETTSNKETTGAEQFLKTFQGRVEKLNDETRQMFVNAFLEGADLLLRYAEADESERLNAKNSVIDFASTLGERQDGDNDDIIESSYDPEASNPTNSSKKTEIEQSVCNLNPRPKSKRLKMDKENMREETSVVFPNGSPERLKYGELIVNSKYESTLLTNMLKCLHKS